MTDLILTRGHGFQVDHVGLGVPDTPRGVEWLRNETGGNVTLKDPEPDQWYWSGSLDIGDDSFLEVIGPNPAWSKFQPFGALLKTLSEPTLLFWYIAVSDFSAFVELSRSKKAKLERIEEVNLNSSSPEHSSYKRAYIGPGFMSERPNVIEWVRKADPLSDQAPSCTLTDFRLANPKARKINSVFQSLGINVNVKRGPSSIGLTLDTPKGAWSLDNPGIALTMPGMLFEFAYLWWRTRGR